MTNRTDVCNGCGKKFTYRDLTTFGDHYICSCGYNNLLETEPSSPNKEADDDNP